MRGCWLLRPLHRKPVYNMQLLLCYRPAEKRERPQIPNHRNLPLTLFTIKVEPLQYLSEQIHSKDQVAPLSLASPSVFPVAPAFCGLPPDLAASLAWKLCSKSWMMSSMCSIPTDTRMRSSVTPESIFSWSLSCSCVVVQGWIARVLASPTLRDVSNLGQIR